MQILVNIYYQFSGMVRPLEIEHTDTVTRGEAAKYLVIAFDVNPRGVIPYQSGTQTMQTPFMDIFAHPYQTAISTLAGLGIVSVDTPKFSPDNYLHRYDFVIMLVNSLLASRGKTLSAGYVS